MSTLDTTGWIEFPFSTQGHDFVSKLSPTSPFLKRVLNLPAGAFTQMNAEAIRDLVGYGATRSEIIERLAIANEGASHAVLEIV